MQIKYDLVTLAGLLELPQLAQALRSVVKCAPSSTACAQYRELFDHVQSATEPSGPDIRTDPLAPDVALYLRDKVVHTHSVVLRARCPSSRHSLGIRFGLRVDETGLVSSISGWIILSGR
ncbi:hypothetical protein EDD17DRAFT_423136 [Pisolithus thermaeus]|nr:hypothetical protein EDD17DRAFT_423136 [Pisolithus thermaeus]